MRLAKQIVSVLRRLKGERLDLALLAAHLGLARGAGGDGWQNVCRLAFEMAKLAEYERISCDGPLVWIEQPRPETQEPITP